MDAHKLVKMANEIASFFEAEADRTVALDGVAGHLRRFWDPRMRRELLRWVDEHSGEGLHELTRAAIDAHRGTLQPAAAPRV